MKSFEQIWLDKLTKYDPIMWYRWLLPIASFTLPLHNRLNVIVLLCLTIVWLFLDGSPAVKWNRIRSVTTNRKILLAGLIYLIYLAGLAYTSNFREGLFNLEIKLSLLMAPLIYATMSKEYFSHTGVRNILYGFIAGVTLTMLICLGRSLILHMQGEGYHVFYYSYLSFYHHPTYLAMYLVFSLVLLYFLSEEKRKSMGITESVVYVLLSLFFSASVFLLSSKAGILSLLMALTYILLIELFNRKQILRGLSLFILGLGMFALFYIIFPNASHRIEAARETITNGDQSINYSSAAIRIEIWKSTREIISKHSFFGVGTGDVQDALNDVYLTRDMEMAKVSQLNPHNQYIQTLLAIGLPGLTALLLMILLPLWFAFRKRYWVYLFFLLLFGGNMMFESMLEKQSGVVFYTFFNTFMLFLLIRSGDKLP